MIEAIKNLPQPALIAICIGVYIIIAVIFTFVTGLITDDDALEYLGIFWIVAISVMVFFGVLWFFSVIFKFANKKPWRNIKRKDEEVYNMKDTPIFSRPTASVDIYRCPVCGEEFLMDYKAPYCDHCGAEFEPMDNPRGDYYD